ncbi:hypothetical protein EVA_18951 [gut metagenome]|uniref:Uncharacterized protein n=1 Tax=gut metagenome TaxID=749906 RepID=J9FDG2_9ZZZZ
MRITRCMMPTTSVGIYLQTAVIILETNDIIIQHRPVFSQNLGVFRIFCQVNLFTRILLHVIKFLPVAFQIMSVLISRSAHHTSRSRDISILCMPFRHDIRMRLLLFLAP